jgi:hypothetical protein
MTNQWNCVSVFDGVTERLCMPAFTKEDILFCSVRCLDPGTSQKQPGRFGGADPRPKKTCPKVLRKLSFVRWDARTPGSCLSPRSPVALVVSRSKRTSQTPPGPKRDVARTVSRSTIRSQLESFCAVQEAAPKSNGCEPTDTIGLPARSWTGLGPER